MHLKYDRKFRNNRLTLVPLAFRGMFESGCREKPSNGVITDEIHPNFIA